MRRDAAGALTRALAKWSSSWALPSRKRWRTSATPSVETGSEMASIARLGRDSGSGRHEGGRRRAAGRQREHFVAGLGDEHGVLPLRGERAVFRDDGPAVSQLADLA